MTLSESMETLRRELSALRETIQKSVPGERDLYSAEEVARRLSISLSTVRVLIARGELRYLRIGNLVRVPRSSIERFCRSNHYEVWGAKDPGTGRTRRPTRMRSAGRGAKNIPAVDGHFAGGSKLGEASVFRGARPSGGQPSTEPDTAARECGIGKGARRQRNGQSGTKVPSGDASGPAIGNQHGLPARVTSAR